MRSSLGGDENQGGELLGVGATADDVPAACPIDRSATGTYGHSRTALNLGAQTWKACWRADADSFSGPLAELEE
jgi:hypothetical protein